VAKTEKPVVELVTSREDAGERHVSKKLGGVTVYAPTSKDYERGISDCENALDFALKLNLLVPKQRVFSDVKKSCPHYRNERLLGAVLGRMLRYGRAGVLPCLTQNARIFRLYFHPDSYALLLDWISIANDALNRKGLLSVDQLMHCRLRNQFGLSRLCAAQIMWHLAFTGAAIWTGDDNFVSVDRLLDRALDNN
jgi:hypothetical protein